MYFWDTWITGIAADLSKIFLYLSYVQFSSHFHAKLHFRFSLGVFDAVFLIVQKDLTGGLAVRPPFRIFKAGTIMH